jgi:Lrp/AsnC family transcriptional regulator for asnA, asnC and gidA
MDLDETDRAILRVLSSDARLSYRDIAKQLGTSHASVSARVKGMEEAGLIKGYTAVTDPYAEGLYPLCLRISAKPGHDLTEIGKRLSQLPEVHTAMRVSGDCELLALTMSESREKALELLSRISAIDGIEKAESHVVLDSIKISGFELKDKLPRRAEWLPQ